MTRTVPNFRPRRRVARHRASGTRQSSIWTSIRVRVLWAGLVLLLTAAVAPSSVQAQQKIGHIDSQYILDRLPEYKTVQQKLDQVEQQWRAEIEEARKRVEELRQEFQARELLYTDEERAERQKEIDEARREVEALRQRYFGPNGELFARQRELMRPIQERILVAVEEVATSDGYDYVLDQRGDLLFMYAREQNNLSDAVLRELGVDVDRQQNNAAPTNGTQPQGNGPGRRNN